MNNISKTLYIPLYGKAFVSKKGIILHDKKAEKIWNEKGFKLKGKSKSKWLAYYMGMRSAVFDNWLRKQMKQNEDAIVVHIGCGMDSRVERVGTKGHLWYDVDFPDVILERKHYYEETDMYHMIKADIRELAWIKSLPKARKVIIVMEGVSMYLTLKELRQLLKNLGKQFEQIYILMDCYTVFAAKASKYKNPIHDVGVTMVYGIDKPSVLEKGTNFSFMKEHEMTPKYLVNELKGMEKIIFERIFAGKLSKKMYRLYEYRKL